jgi:hypothetical protein
MAYLGTSDAFAMGWDAARAARALRELSPALGLPEGLPIGVAGRGACASQAAMYAALMEPEFVAFVAGFDGPREHADCLDAGVPTYAIQFRAADSAPLAHLRSLVRAPAAWHFRGDPPPDPSGTVRALIRP